MDLDQVSLTGSMPVPRSWRSVTLDDIVSDEGVFVDGDWVESKDQDPAGDVRLIQLADIGDGEYRDRSERFLTSEKASDLGCTFLQPGDLLIARMPDPLGRACIFPGDRKRAVTVVDVAVVRPRNSEVNARWLMYCINAPQFRRVVASLQSGSTRQRISRKNLAKIVFLLPPLHRQDEVVAEIEKQFSRLGEAVANLNRVIRWLARYRNRALDDAFAPDPNAALGELISVGPQNGLYLPKDAYGSGTPMLRIDDYQTDWIRPVEELRRVRATESQVSTWALQAGDLLVNRVNSMSHLGKCVVTPNVLAGVLFESNMMRFGLVPGVLPRYVELYLGSRIGKRRLTANAKWAVNQASINQKDVQATVIPLPSLERQAQIVAEIDRRLSIVREVEAEVDANLKRAQALRHAVLRRHFQACGVGGG